QGEANGNFEEFHYQKNNISWFPDGKRFAFVSKTSDGDKIYIMNVENKRLVYEILLPEFSSIFEIDVSHDGNKIAFCGQKDEQSDIFVYDISSGEVTSITNDHYHDYQPSWSPDDSKIAFASERSFTAKDEHVFFALSTDIFYYDFVEDAFYQVTDDIADDDTPIWNKTGDQIIFIAEGSLSTNFQVIDLKSGQRAAVTNILGGVFTGDLNADDSDLIFSCFYDGGWDIYQKSNPLDSLEYHDYKIPEKVEFQDDLFAKINLEDYEYYGERKREFKAEAPGYPHRVTQLTLEDFAATDSLRQIHNQTIDDKPTEKKPPVISDYKTKFALDYIWGGMAYSPTDGTYAQIQMGLSDLMGNHELDFNLGISGSLDTSDFIIDYLYLANRVDYGIGTFMLNDELYYITYLFGDDDYFRERTKEYGLYSIVRYPFNKFWRIDLENTVYRIETRRDWWENNHWHEDYLPSAFIDYYGLKAYEDEDIYAP
ncbi:MAG TPA: hypothetical protein PLD62_11570, partial [Candidatus Cloacimonadota bacterium]|nr:hypothetical protein [Candidatus Cloacimonadota bacterium]